MSPELPMQLMQPNPQVKKPSFASAPVSPARSRSSCVAWLPGARIFLTQGLGERPRSTARLARRPAATIMAGSVAVVQLVMAAMARAPW